MGVAGSGYGPFTKALDAGQLRCPVLEGGGAMVERYRAETEPDSQRFNWRRWHLGKSGSPTRRRR